MQNQKVEPDSIQSADTSRQIRRRPAASVFEQARVGGTRASKRCNDVHFRPCFSGPSFKS
jgi:hypothetical protein